MRKSWGKSERKNTHIANSLWYNLELYKNTWGKSGEPLSIVSGLQEDHYSHLTQFLDSIVEGLDPHYTLTRQVQTFPVVNVNAVQSGSRLWPFDGMDMDLAFPGNPEGETAEAIASTLLQHTKDSFWGIIFKNYILNLNSHLAIMCLREN